MAKIYATLTVALIALLCGAWATAGLYFQDSAQSVTFPSGFKWCVATSAHQIEGGNSNSDWWDFERVPGKIKNGDHSGAACDHWNRLEEDTRLMQDLGANMYRFSIEWAKIEPTPGQWDMNAVDHYRREIALLLASGIEPMVTLNHFTLPRWAREKGGWEWDGMPQAFANFAAFAVEQLGRGVRDWVTINEPMVHLTLGYLAGLQPPGRLGTINDLKKPVLGMLKSHAAAYHAMKAKHTEVARQGDRPIRIGIAHHLRIFDPVPGWNPANGFLAEKLDHAFNWAFAEAVETGRLRYKIPFSKAVDEHIEGLRGTQDFFGLNYYTRDLVEVILGSPGFKLSVPKDAELNDMGWEIYPEGFYRILKAVGQRFPGKPVVITENGIADARDTKRVKFIESHLAAMAKAMSEGVVVEGYCHWSLMDNFEWSEGFEPRFGLYHVNYATQKRTPRPSARRFAEIATTNRL